MKNIFALVLPFVAATSWYFVAKRNTRSNQFKKGVVPKDYLLGLNFLLNEQPDKAVDIFIKMLEVDSDTVETHLALGSLFRRRGEVDRAIRIHQNLIARPRLDKQERNMALIALGQDYMSAGMFDRAERIFLEVVASGEETIASLYYLLDIYQQEKAWQEASEIAQKISDKTGEAMHCQIAQYYCEQAVHVKNVNLNLAKKHLKKALTIDKSCIRANLLLGEVAMQEEKYADSIEYYEAIKQQDVDFISETLIPLKQCYEALNKRNEFINYLQKLLTQHARISLILVLADLVLQEQGANAAIELITTYLYRYPSVRGLKRLIELQLLQSPDENSKTLYLLQSIATSILLDKPIYRCHHCGFSSKSLLWLCPSCKSWNTVKPIHGLEGD
ncbi:MAG: lipopolysaccharide assembly protein LapB [Gammaproteobacteria bacterium]